MYKLTPAALHASRSLDGSEQPTGRREKAFLAIEGTNAGLLTANPWNPVFTFDSSVTAQARVGGLSIRLRLSDPIDVLDTEKLAALWDDQVLAAGPLVVREGDEVVITISEVKGNILSLWCTDVLSVDIVKVANLNQAGAIRSEIEAEKRRQQLVDDKTINPVSRFFAQLFDTQKTVGTALLVVAAVGGYLYLKKGGLNG